MRTPVYSTQFRRDVKLAEKRRKDLGKLKTLITLLLTGAPLPATYRDHPLKGEWGSFRDAHIEPDWLLIYKIDGTVLRLERTGTHADLFRE
ncbi:type II toxin-antitoxin system mRNA interferase toxin, RelE/StbE family [Burkholderia metallica]|uniref:type II toxin-antitoxin system YafQ family toxin n=1 Tax=Burkholderia cepacia complex TaxID=87882 RepID=UPI0006186F7D|nr:MULTISPECIES: type II toxin-antitoxin system mRNA interferase toxin, RelE/StbE family [Burkholderia cepacia complex]MCA7888884.1 type II toxin-antitoxin system mRNA interferase toxin, RelE/StbE family [Burkholderia contaminans]NTZ86217.1 type II toxin-antitoxin system mRNA interferase toxin, RelE/StbE family [Burkholderia metallica]